MDKLKIVNPTSIDLGDALGITTDRLITLSKGMDEMVNRASAGEVRLVYTVDIINYIRGLCHTEEEFIWAYHNHIIWMARTNRLFTTAEAQTVAIEKFGKPFNFK